MDLSWELAGTAGLMGKGLFFEFIKHLPMEGKKWKFLSHGALLGLLFVEGTRG